MDRTLILDINKVRIDIDTIDFLQLRVFEYSVDKLTRPHATEQVLESTLVPGTRVPSHAKAVSGCPVEKRAARGHLPAGRCAGARVWRPEIGCEYHKLACQLADGIALSV